MRQAVSVPVTVKIRLGWTDDRRNYLDVARAAVDAGAAALTVHGRTRQARYRHPADWEAIAEVAGAVQVPVIGNGDLLSPHEIADRIATSGCRAVMAARGALIKPWIFKEAIEGEWDITADERVRIYRRYVELALDHWGRDDHGRDRVRTFLRWHVGFWCRYAPRNADGSMPQMQERRSINARSPLEALLARQDAESLEYVTGELLGGGDLADPPRPSDGVEEPAMAEAG
jgi:tRNA-dihydrouridine synthase 3